MFNRLFGIGMRLALQIFFFLVGIRNSQRVFILNKEKQITLNFKQTDVIFLGYVYYLLLSLWLHKCSKLLEQLVYL